MCVLKVQFHWQGNVRDFFSLFFDLVILIENVPKPRVLWASENPDERVDKPSTLMLRSYEDDI